MWDTAELSRGAGQEACSRMGAEQGAGSGPQLYLWGPIALQSCHCKWPIDISYILVWIMWDESPLVFGDWFCFLLCFEVHINTNMFVCIRPNMPCLGLNPSFLFLCIQLWQPQGNICTELQFSSSWVWSASFSFALHRECSAGCAWEPRVSGQAQSLWHL